MRKPVSHNNGQGCLQAWDGEFPDKLQQKLCSLHSRRQFLATLFKSGLLASCYPLTCGTTAAAETDNSESLLIEPWKTFALVQEHLFPGDGNSPGAGDIQATPYLQFVLKAPDTDAEIRELILKGIDWLNDYSNEQMQRPFGKLSWPEQEKILKGIDSSRAGRNWLSILLMYLFEALFCAPVYGGNPEGVGWRWLEHKPGYPLPPMNKRYVDLL